LVNQVKVINIRTYLVDWEYIQ